MRHRNAALLLDLIIIDHYEHGLEAPCYVVETDTQDTPGTVVLQILSPAYRHFLMNRFASTPFPAPD